MKHFIGIDLGTQSMKGILMAPDGTQLAQASVSYIPDFPRPNWCEHDVTVWENALRDVVQSLIAASSVTPSEVGMIGFASQCGGVVPIGYDGVPLRKCILWLDRRSEPQCEKIKEHISVEDALHLVGSAITSTLRAPKIMWLRDNEPEVYQKTMAFLEVGEYMVYFLTGELVSDYAHTSITCLYDVANREFSPRMSKITGINPDKLCEVRAAADIAGNLKKNVAEFLGLTEATQVVVGSGDQHAGSIGSGLVGPGQILNIMGTSEIIAGASAAPVYDEANLLKTHLHVDPKYWQIEQGALISGACMRWYVDNLARMTYAEMNAEAAKVPAGSNGLLFLPALSGSNSPEVNGYARGIFFGLTMSHTLPFLTRAVYEGCAFAFRDNINRLISMNMGDGDIIATGGGTKSELWMQIKADVVGKEIKVIKNCEPTALGAAMLAGVAQKNFSSFQEAVDQLLEYGRSYTPNPAMKSVYDNMYGFYRNLYFTNKPLFEQYKTMN